MRKPSHCNDYLCVLTCFAVFNCSRYDGAEDTDELVLLSAHYDSRGSFGSTRAPGGDDDGSGTTSILSIARAIGTTGIKFKKNVELCLFAGEEQGLVGSSAYARASASFPRFIGIDGRFSRRAEETGRGYHLDDPG